MADRNHPRRIAVIVSLLVAFLFFLTSLFFTLPHNVISNGANSSLRTFFVDLAPQNWAFFTRSPREEEYVPYSNEEHSYILETPQNKSSNMLGISRDQRAQGVELGAIVRGIESWNECSSESECISAGQKGKVDSIPSISNDPTICGDALIMSREITSWSYREILDEEYEYNKVGHVNVKCS
ncbi:SdpA family antimicrobial peptide system protein [Corynebacterium neomassiliense]|uniref:SdpA family antimicrobial peptide system protein n=1 Tax=Corynebacterium neomassiliense TaxID=2079482 RepID=UPI00102FC042|nr:SdpA family antimicrobial peptide system protein [Corynebacterium neomassiliense]